MIKGSCDFNAGASHGKSTPYLVQWCTWVFCKWRYNRFSLWRDLKVPPHWGSSELWVGIYHPDKCGDNRDREGGDLFLICHVISCDHMFKGLCYFVGGSLSRQITSLPCWGRDYWSCATGNKKYFICCVISQNEVIEQSCNFMIRSLLYFTNLPSLILL